MSATPPDGPVCVTCGEVHTRCSAHSSRTGRPCQGQPITGARVCRHHGGSAPQVRAAARRRIEHARAEAAVATYGLPVTIDPTDALLQEIHRTAGHVAWLGQIVAQLDPDHVVFGLAKTSYESRTDGEVTKTEHAAAVNTWVDLYLRERRHLADVCSRALAAGVAQRQVAMAERQGEILGALLRDVLDHLGIQGQARLDVLAHSRERLVVLTGGAA